MRNQPARRRSPVAEVPDAFDTWGNTECERLNIQRRRAPVGRHGDAYVFVCRRSALRGGGSLKLHAEEQALRAARAEWADPARQQQYRRRGEGERLIAQMVRHGSRQARAFGLRAANLQAHCIAITSNLGILARMLADRLCPTPVAPLPLFPDSS